MLRQGAPGKSRFAPSSISAGILLSRGWGPGANYSAAVLPNPRKDAWAEPFYPKWCPLIRPAGREEIHIETTAIRESLSMLASGGGLSYGSPAAPLERPSHLILIWLYSSQVAERPSLDKKQNAPSPTALSSAGDFNEMKTGGIVVCSTFVALVYIPEYSSGRSKLPNLLKQPKGLALSCLENDPLWHGLVSYSRSSDKIRPVRSLKAWFLPLPL
ncbi:hypothetical protein HAX54_024760 [Datura stramonium]|uniref:Uncharacterized protein n=1 Tax=Datura stramonium TaxID=4076 RepID=A0ABS8S6G6_DATST|nr:hypothetical protein [Datura stramonium]